MGFMKRCYQKVKNKINELEKSKIKDHAKQSQLSGKLTKTS